MEVQKIYHLVGEQPVPVFMPAIQFEQNVQHYLLVTDAGKVKKAADNIQAELKRCGHQCEIISLGSRETSTDFFQLNQKISEILSTTNPNGVNSAFNVTGGTKPMAFMALRNTGKNKWLRPFYLDFEKSKSLVWLDDFEGTKISKLLTLENFIGLAGFAMPGKKQSDCQQYEKLSKLSFSVSDVLQRYQEQFAVLQNKQNKKGFDSIFQELCGIMKKRNAGWIKMFQEVFQGQAWGNQAGYLAGGWLENYVYSVIRTHPEITGIRQSLPLRWANGEPAQEFDVVYTNGWELVILECKAGRIQQEYLQKLENLRDTFSGALGRCAMVTLNESTTKSNRKASFAKRIENSRKIAAFCGDTGIKFLPSNVFGFQTGKIYGK